MTTFGIHSRFPRVTLYDDIWQKLLISQGHTLLRCFYGNVLVSQDHTLSQCSYETHQLHRVAFYHDIVFYKNTLAFKGHNFATKTCQSLRDTLSNNVANKNILTRLRLTGFIIYHKVVLKQLHLLVSLFVQNIIVSQLGPCTLSHCSRAPQISSYGVIEHYICILLQHQLLISLSNNVLHFYTGLLHLLAKIQRKY